MRAIRATLCQAVLLVMVVSGTLKRHCDASIISMMFVALFVGCSNHERTPQSVEQAIARGYLVTTFFDEGGAPSATNRVSDVWMYSDPERPKMYPFLVVTFYDSHVRKEPRIHVKSASRCFYLELVELSDGKFLERWQMSGPIPPEVTLSCGDKTLTFVQTKNKSKEKAVLNAKPTAKSGG